MRCRSNKVFILFLIQICRTWLNISELEERRGDVYGSVGRTYMTAFGHAKKAGNVQLQVSKMTGCVMLVNFPAI